MSKTADRMKGLGAERNIADNRNISYAVVAAVKGINTAEHPKKNITDISMLPVEDQKRLGSCVGQSEGKGEEYREFKETGVVRRLSKRYIYKRCKDQDGLAGEGTFPIIAAKVLKDEGAPGVNLVADNNDLPHDQFIAFTVTPEIRTDASRTRVDGYAFPKTLDELKTAVDQEGVLNVSVQVGDWDTLPVKPIEKDGSNNGLHRILVHGYEDAKNGKVADTKIYFRNSWGINWAKVKSTKDKALQKEGNGWFWWSEYLGLVYDMQVYTDMPNELIDYARATAYIFPRELDEGDRGPDVTELQKRLNTIMAKDGQPCFRYPSAAKPEFTQYFGVNTVEAVERFQCVRGIACKGNPKDNGYGRVGPLTLSALNGVVAKPGLYPQVADLRDALVAIMAAVDLPIVVTDQYRTIAEQDELYAQGRTKPGAIVTNAKGGESLHNYRVAFDVAFKKGNGITYEGPWDKLARVGKYLGLEWGGDWTSFPDKPHFQYLAGYTLADFQAGRIDESRFGVEITKAALPNSNTSMSKRIKSFGIVFGSVLIPTLIAFASSVEFANLVQYLGEVAARAGIPSVVWAAIIGLIAQLWMAWRNSVNIKKFEEGQYRGQAVGSSRENALPDLY